MTLIDDDYTFFGMSAVYTDADGVEETVTIVEIDEESGDRQIGGGRESGVTRHMTQFAMRQCDLTIAERPIPFDGTGGKFVINDGAGTEQEWRIVADGVEERRTCQDFGAEWVCTVERDVRPVI